MICFPATVLANDSPCPVVDVAPEMLSAKPPLPMIQTMRSAIQVLVHVKVTKNDTFATIWLHCVQTHTFKYIMVDHTILFFFTLKENRNSVIPSAGFAGLDRDNKYR